MNLSETAILMTESPFNPRANREKMSEIMFEKYNFPAVQVRIPLPTLPY